jgi:transposase
VIPHGVDVFVGLDPIDLRWSFDRLSGLVAERIGREARGGALFVFFGKRRDALKILFFDGTGMCLFYKRLDRGTFRVPEPSSRDATAVAIDEASLDAILDGIVLDASPPKKSPRVH